MVNMICIVLVIIVYLFYVFTYYGDVLLRAVCCRCCCDDDDDDDDGDSDSTNATFSNFTVELPRHVKRRKNVVIHVNAMPRVCFNSAEDIGL